MESKIITNGKLEYQVDDFGVHQLNANVFQYDEKYCSTYDTEAYRRGEEILNASRLGFAQAAHNKPIKTILDFGCGNYAFLKQARKVIPYCYGYDISGVPTPDPFIIKLDEWGHIHFDLVTFHDSLEHTEKPIDIINSLNCDTVVISLPKCSIKEKGEDWFFNEYYHLKPNEHLHHFDQVSLDNMMFAIGWECVAVSNHEDIVRKRGNEWNILSMAFKKLL